MEVTAQVHGTILLLQLSGRLDAFGAKQLQEQVTAALQADIRGVVLDLAAVPYLSSAGIRVFISLYRQLQPSGGLVALAAVTPYCKEILELAGLAGSTQMPLLENQAEALSWCARQFWRSRSVRQWDQLEVAESEHGSLRFLPGSDNEGAVLVSGSLTDVLHARTNDKLLSRQQAANGAFSLGIGGLGQEASQVTPVLGPVLTLGSSLVWLPTDGNETPDFVVPDATGKGLTFFSAYHASFGGAFHEYLWFESSTADGVTLGNLCRWLFELSAKRRQDFKGALSFSFWADCAALLGWGLRHPPLAVHAPSNGKPITHRDNASEWITVDREPRHRDVTVLGCALAVDLTRDLSVYEADEFNACFYLNPANIGGKRELIQADAVVFESLPAPDRDQSLDAVMKHILSNGEFRDMRALQEQTRFTRALIGVNCVQVFRAKAPLAGPSVVATPTPPPQPERYRIDALLGEGGMGEVYRGFDLLLQRPVAIKKLRAGMDGMQERFELEAQTAARLFKHPGVVTVLDMLTHPWPAIVMELVEGTSLSRLIADGVLQAREILEVMEQTADVLAYAHEMGVIHRDIKPDNVLVESTPLRAKITDFGIAKVRASSVQTLHGYIMGTPSYMSPEQAVGESVDHRTDIFAWGVMCYEMWCGGQLPFSDKGVLQLVKAGTPPPLERLLVFPLSTKAKAHLCQLVMACLSKQPAGRPDSFGTILKRLATLKPLAFI